MPRRRFMAAVDQVSRSSQQQAPATHQMATALNQIESTAKLSETQMRARQAIGFGRWKPHLRSSRTAVERLVTGVSDALKETRVSVTTIGRLELVGRRIEKIVDAIALIAVQTSMLAVSGSVESGAGGRCGQGVRRRFK